MAEASKEKQQFQLLNRSDIIVMEQPCYQAREKIEKGRKPIENSKRAEDCSTGYIIYCAYKRLMSDISNTMKKREKTTDYVAAGIKTQVRPPEYRHRREWERASIRRQSVGG